MARRSADLLDVFRTDRDAAARGSASAPPHATSARTSKAKEAFAGVFLVPRQLLLGSAVVVLLLVFAFVLGLSVGRRGGETSPDALQRSTTRSGALDADDETRVFVVARVPYVNQRARGTTNEPRTLMRALVEVKGVPADRVWILNERGSQSWAVVLGPFADRRLATRFLAENLLTKSLLGGVYPFEQAEFRSLPLSGLPAERLPSP